MYSKLVTQPRWNPPDIGMNVTPGYPFFELKYLPLKIDIVVITINKNPRSVKRQFWEISIGQSNIHFL